ncbi:response regulator transcription factor [Winogradskyella maritima]|uniref:Response regulator n=1 Tax=Winogradskyella maritima TaxID=1517766 RepID=A0ABV8AF71_9FLAO|nr:response regulator transcription factor [Winogradskyella maritima]
MKLIKIMVADDNRLFCEALSESLNQYEEMSVICQCYTIEALLERCSTSSFDVLILDVNFKGKSALDYISEMKSSAFSFSIIALSSMNRSYFKNVALQKGVDVFLGKDSSLSLIKSTIIDCYNFKNKVLGNGSTSKIRVNNMVFTQRKLDLLQAFYTHADKNDDELAEALNVSLNTIKSHKRELFDITDTKNIKELIRFGIDSGLILTN